MTLRSSTIQNTPISETDVINKHGMSAKHLNATSPLSLIDGA
jgi:hypothetical protein